MKKCEYDVVFLAGLFPKETEHEIIEKSIGVIQNAANNLQWEFVRGLDINLENQVKIINSMYIGSFPRRYKELNIKTHKFSHSPESTDDINVGYCNLTGVKILSRYFSVKPFIKKWSSEGGTNRKVIIAYAMTFQFTQLLRYAKKLNANIVTCLIVPDLPQYMNTARKKDLLYSIFKKIEIYLINRNIRHIDSFVFLTKYMAEFLGCNKPFVVIEGIASSFSSNSVKIDCFDNLKTVFYSGGLMEKYGILDLISAFEKIEDANYRLVICGAGEAESQIKDSCKRDKRIIFKGLISREEVLQLQKSCTVLINPRKNNEEYTKYSFPSKVIEYMSSGRPVLAYKLDGMPDEYHEYVYLFEDESVEGMVKTLEHILNLPAEELHAKGLAAREFVLREKNNVVQAKRIVEMISDNFFMNENDRF